APFAPLLSAQGQKGGQGAARLVGPERTASRRPAPHHPVERSAADRARRLPCLLTGTEQDRPAPLRTALDRCAAKARACSGGLRASDGAERTSLSAVELSWQSARRDDSCA